MIRCSLSARVFAFLFLAITASGNEADQNWLSLRGPDHDAHTRWSGIALPWDGGRPRLLWKIPLGQGYSGIIIAYGKAYTQTQTRSGQYAVCLDVNTGAEIWRSRYGWPWRMNDRYPGPYSTPTYHEGRIYVADCYGIVVCMDSRNGRILWKVNATKDYDGTGTGFGYGCSPLVQDGRVYLPVGGKGASVVAFDAEDGSVVWKSGDDAASYSSCYPIVVQGHTQIVSFLQNVVVANDPRTGAELWRDSISHDSYDEHATAPLFDDPYLFVAAPFRRGARVLKLSYDDGAHPRAELVWRSKVMCSDVMSSVLVDGYVYGFDVRDTQAGPYGDTKGDFKCVELATGREMWASKAPGHASVLRCGDKLVLLNEDGVLVIAAADPSAYRELARATVMENKRPCWTVPTVYKGLLLVRNHEYAACYLVGTEKDAPPVGSRTARAQTGFLALDPALKWLDKHQDGAFWGPSFSEFMLWYFFCIVLLGLSWILSRQVAGNTGRMAAMTGLCAFTGLFGMPLFSVLADKLVLTWPVALYAVFLAVLDAGSKANRRPGSAIRARIGLLLFAVFCAGYYFACQYLFILSGVAFLIGFVPAWPVTRPFVRLVSEGVIGAKAVFLGLLSFSIYYWTSALFMLWKNG